MSRIVVLFQILVFVFGYLSQAQALSSFDQLKIDVQKTAFFQNAAFDDVAGIQTLELMIQLGGRYFQLPYLMGKRSKIIASAKSPSFQALIDELMKEILLTSTGQKFCRDLLSGHPELLVHQIGVSRQMSLELSGRCQGQQITVNNLHPAKAKQYVLLLIDDEDNPVQGWTNSFNVTFIPILAQELTKEHLLKVLIHELVVQFDAKEGVGSWYNSDALPTGSVSNCKVLNAIRNPILKYAFVSLRAQKLENQIIEELGYKVESRNELSCPSSVRQEIPQILRMIPLVQPELIIQAALSASQGCNRETIDWSEGLSVIEASNLCEYLSTPEIGFNFGSPTSGGPRPRPQPWGAKETEKILNSSKSIEEEIFSQRQPVFPSFKEWDAKIRVYQQKDDVLKIPIETNEGLRLDGKK